MVAEIQKERFATLKLPAQAILDRCLSVCWRSRRIWDVLRKGPGVSPRGRVRKVWWAAIRRILGTQGPVRWRMQPRWRAEMSRGVRRTERAFHLVEEGIRRRAGRRWRNQTGSIVHRGMKINRTGGSVLRRAGSEHWARASVYKGTRILCRLWARLSVVWTMPGRCGCYDVEGVKRRG